jgi:acetylornithine deacetylase/succinyl-diaminopimelate desuccinylase-like protein
VARQSLEEVFGRDPALVREGLSIPIVSLFRKILGRDTVLVGLGLPDCSAHGPNESFPLANLEQGIAVHRGILARLGS